VWERLPGWEEELVGDALPVAARGYVRFVEEALDVPVALVGTGAGRESVLALR
jgi:adenylosuccinate synthase